MDIKNILDHRSSSFSPDPPQSQNHSLSAQQHSKKLASHTNPYIPYKLDLITGSSSAAKKRKGSCEASRRFRNRRCEANQHESLVNTLQNDISFLQMLVGFYKSERDYYRHELYQYALPSQLPARPPTPQPL
ncbi:hypothetical protein N7522_006450 [Penicillium canescens]|nr:hypothetical protein N7522_006450 [Penicillium canescens]